MTLDLAAPFREGTTLDSFSPEPIPLVMSVETVGHLVVTSGRVIACDPTAIVGPDPFTLEVPTGRHPVVVAIARHEGGDERIACAMLRLADDSPESVARWELAVTSEQDPAELGPGDYFGYPVDAGTGCFMDAALWGAWSAWTEDFEMASDAMEAERKKVYRSTRDWADLRPDPAQDENVVLFSSGYGDGMYPTYAGYAEDGRLLALVTDFIVVDVGAEMAPESS